MQDDGPRRANQLNLLLSVVTEANNAVDRDSIARECAKRFDAAPNGVEALQWLKGLFRLDAVAATQLFVSTLSNHNDSNTRHRAIEYFADNLWRPISCGTRY